MNKGRTKYRDTDSLRNMTIIRLIHTYYYSEVYLDGKEFSCPTVYGSTGLFRCLSIEGKVYSNLFMYMGSQDYLGVYL